MKFFTEICSFQMPQLDIDIIKEVFHVSNFNFDPLAIQVFQYQYAHNSLYREYCDLLKKGPGNVHTILDIPYLPIVFFKTHTIISGAHPVQLIFESSGTTGMISSKHYLTNEEIYKESFLKTFARFFGDPAQYCILGLLPNYLEKGNSSLVYMVQELTRLSKHRNSGFYLHEWEALAKTLIENEKNKIKTILFGVTYALLDFADKFPMPLQYCQVIETGGMKGRKKEITRSEVHTILKEKFHLKEIASEYGMTELLSQAYARKDGQFSCPPWMQVLIRAEDDPYAVSTVPGTSGVINIIDLANIYSCAFIATDDVGHITNTNHFEITGRLDVTDLRGCSLLTA